MTTGENIRMYRKIRKLSQQDLGKVLGLAANTISDIERGKYALSADLLGPLCWELGVMPADILDINDNKGQHQRAMHDWGRPILVAYLEATDNTQENICKLLDLPHVTVNGTRKEKHDPSIETIDMLVYEYPAAAGLPLYAESDFVHVEVPAVEVPRGADFGIRISGDSMEPTFEDDAIVWVHKQTDIGDGQIGIFMLGDSAVCKRARLRPDGRLLGLESENPKYNPITGDDLSDVKCVGRVLL